MADQEKHRIFIELQRRNVFRVGVAYLVTAWLLAQVADLILDAIDAPKSVMLSFLILLGIGFLITVVFAWIYEITPEGLKREHEVDRAKSITHQTGRKLDFGIIGILAIAIIFLVIERFGWIGTPSDATAPVTKRSVAVLPFINRSGNVSDTYFVDGIHDDLLTQLSKISAFKVVSRTSVERFRETTRSIPDIGAELSADSIIEGAVQRAGDRVRITVQLIDADSDDHIWAESYDREVSAANVFAIQSEIATAIAKQLKMTLSPEEAVQLSNLPTENFLAYDLYLQGAQALRESYAGALDTAAELFRAALELDPEYARAYAGMCKVFLRRYQSSNNTSLVPRAESYCQKAIEIDNNLIEVRMSLGSLLETTGQYAESEAEYRKAIDMDSDYAEAHSDLGQVLAKQGKIDDAEASLRHAISLEPSDPVVLESLADFFFTQGRIKDAIDVYEELVRLEPDLPYSYNGLGASYYLDANFADAEAAWRKSLAIDDNQPTLLSNLGTMYFFERRFADAANAYQDATKLRPEDALIWSYLGDAYRFMDGMESESLAAYDRSIGLSEQRINVNANDIEAISSLARLYATRGMVEDAEEYIQKSIESDQKDMYVWYEVALAYIALERDDDAVEAVKRLLDAGYSADVLRGDAMFTELSARSDFRAFFDSDESSN